MSSAGTWRLRLGLRCEGDGTCRPAKAAFLVREAGSNPQKEHALEFVFLGEDGSLRKLAKVLKDRGYQPLRANEAGGGEMVQVKKMKLEIPAIAAESVSLSRLAVMLLTE